MDVKMKIIIGLIVALGLTVGALAMGKDVKLELGDTSVTLSDGTVEPLSNTIVRVSEDVGVVRDHVNLLIDEMYDSWLTNINKQAWKFDNDPDDIKPRDIDNAVRHCSQLPARLINGVISRQCDKITEYAMTR